MEDTPTQLTNDFPFVTYTFKCQNGTLEVNTDHAGNWSTSSTLKDDQNDSDWHRRDEFDAGIDAIESMIAGMCDRCLVAKDGDIMEDGQVSINHLVLVIDSTIEALANNLA